MSNKLGDFKLIGIVVDNTSSNILGYVLLNMIKPGILALNNKQILEFSGKYNIDNLEIRGSKISCTECSINRLIKFNTNLKCIDSPKIIILGELYDRDNNHIGYKICTNSGKIIDLSEDELIKLIDRSKAILANGKLVHNNTSTYISAIKSKFREFKSSKPKKDYKKIYRDNVVKFIAPKLLSNMIIGTELPLSMLSSHNKIALQRYTRVLIDEVILPNIKLCDRDRILLDKLRERINILSDEYTKVGEIGKSEIKLAAAITQFTWLDDSIREIAKSCITHNRSLCKYSLAMELDKDGLAFSKIHELIEIHKVMYKEHEEEYNLALYVRDQSFANITNVRINNIYDRLRNSCEILISPLSNEFDIRDLGYTLDIDEDHEEFENKFGYIYYLQYIGKNMDKDLYNKYKSLSHGFGDIATITIINDRLDNLLPSSYVYGDTRYRNEIEEFVKLIQSNPNWQADIKNMEAKYHMLGGNRSKSPSMRAARRRMYYYDRALAEIGHIEVLFSLLAIFNRKLAKTYLNDIAIQYPNLGLVNIILPGFDFDREFSYNISDLMKIYYESGYNVCKLSRPMVDLLKTSKGKAIERLYEYRRNSLYNFGKLYKPSVKIYHPEFDELADIIYKVTSELNDKSSILDTLGFLRSRSYRIYIQ